MAETISSLKSFYQTAKHKLAPEIFNFIEGGSHDEHALEENRKSFQSVFLSSRVLRGISRISTTTEIGTHILTSPVLIAPSAYQSLLSPNGELDMLRAANRFNTILIQSMFSSIDYAQIAQEKKVPVWLQFYLLKDKAINKNFVQMAKASGFDALVLTVDAPVYAKRERELATPLRFPDNISWDHLKKIGIPVDECLRSGKHLSTLLDSSISWRDLDWLAAETDLPIILKGIIAPEDTTMALRYPAVKGIIISNHGGRQLDSSPPPLIVLKQHKAIADNRIKLFLDGGISRGTDIFKALSLGADATLIGRSALWALAVNGSEGVFQALSILQKELIEAMTLCGCASIKDITDEFIIQRTLS